MPGTITLNDLSKVESDGLPMLDPVTMTVFPNKHVGLLAHFVVNLM
jgi:hypothetical protein